MSTLLSCIYHGLSIRAASLVELNFDFVEGIRPGQIEQIASLPGLKLQKLRITDSVNLTPENICNIVTAQPDLQSITIHDCKRIRLNGSADWIKRCSKLNRLEINTDCPDDIVFDGRLFDALTSRLHLRELVLRARPSSVIRTRSDFGSCQGTFDYLRTLKLRLSNFDDNCSLKKVSVNLQHLDLSITRKLQLCSVEIASKTLEFVSNRFTCLQTFKLRVNMVANLSTNRKCGQDHSFERLSFGNMEKLNSLEMTVYSSERCLASLLRQFKAPNLQCLKLTGFNAIDATSFSDMVKNYPSLECFWAFVYNRNKADSSWLRDLKKLNFLYINGTEYLQLHRLREGESREV